MPLRGVLEACATDLDDLDAPIPGGRRRAPVLPVHGQSRPRAADARGPLPAVHGLHVAAARHRVDLGAHEGGPIL